MVVRGEPDGRTTPGARRGRTALLDHAADRFAEAGLEELVGGVAGVRDVAAAAGVAPATVNHHFPPGGGRRNTRLAAAALRHAALRRGTPVSDATAAAAGAAAADLRAGDPQGLRSLVGIVAENLAGHSSGSAADVALEAQTVALYAALGAAPRSGEAADVLRSYYEALHAVCRAIYEGLLDATGRRVAQGYDVDDLITVIVALADGFVMRGRFDAEAGRSELFADAIVRLFENLTAPRGALFEPDPAERLLPPPSGSNLDPHKRAAVVAAARAVYDRDGWEGLTVAAVAGEAEVSRTTVVSNLGDRGGLAAAVWARWLDGLAAALDDDLAEDRPVAVVVRRHLARLLELTRQHHRLTACFLEGAFAAAVEHPVPRPGDAADPRVVAPVPELLVPAIGAGADAFRPGYADGPANVHDTAALLTNQALHLGTTRPVLTPAEVAHRVCDTTLVGMLRRRPSA